MRQQFNQVKQSLLNILIWNIKSQLNNRQKLSNTQTYTRRKRRNFVHEVQK